MVRSIRLSIVLVFSALFLLVLTACSSLQLSNRETGTLGGTAVGAGLGAIIGSATGDAGVGTAIGAGIGALSGAILGNEVDKKELEDANEEARLAENERILAENRKLIEQLKNQGQDVRLSDRGVVVNIPDVLFGFNRHDLTPLAQETVQEIAEVLRGSADRAISVEGHTDSVGTMRYNQDLSLKRARSVARQLEEEGISRSRLFVRGFGEGDPIASNMTDSGRARNRRVEIIIENE